MKSCIILCGGKGRRMGQDKGLMFLKGKPMILYILKTLADSFDEIILVLRDEEQVQEYHKILDIERLNRMDLALGVNLKIQTDIIKNQGPLSGIATGLMRINSDYALIVPCDSPFVSKDFLGKMYSYAEDAEFGAYIPRWPDGSLEPLHSIYKKNSGKIMVNLLNNGIREVKSLIKHLNVKYIEVESLDKTGRCFKNFNQPEDLP